MDVRKIRRENLAELVRAHHGNKALADAIGTDPAYISQLLSARTKADMGHNLARRIEGALGMPEGSMDQPHGHASRQRSARGRLSESQLGGGHMDYKSESAKRLRQARLGAGFETIEALAAATEHAYSVSRLGNYEQGTRAMSPRVAADLAAVIGCSTGWLLCLDEGSISPEERRLLVSYRMADVRGKEIINRIAESEAQRDQD